MLRVGLTGGIGSGKSTVAARLVERGAVLVDSDRLARDVVAQGTPGLAAVVDAFGPDVLAADGTLDRPALAAVVFDDPAARARLNGIVHPLVRQRSAELIAAVPEDSIVVQDIPLLVEGGMAARFPLVVVVHADASVRVRRLVEQRGMPEADARARIAAQADDAARRAVADVWLDNSGPPEALVATVDGLWERRLTPFAAALAAGRPASVSQALVRPDPGWPAQAARLGARVGAAAGERGRGVAHVGATAVPDLPAPDVLDLLLGVPTPAAADELRGPLAEAGFVPADAGRPRVRVCVGGSRQTRPPPGARLRLTRMAGCPAPAGLVARRPPGQGPVPGGSARSGDPGSGGRALGRIVGVGAVVERDETGRLTADRP